MLTFPRFAYSASLAATLLGLLIGCQTGLGTTASSGSPQASRAPIALADAEGKWIGQWSGGSPNCKLIECIAVRQKDDTWSAKFRAQCDKEYFYDVEMTGKTVGKVVVFNGSVDLGGQYGVYNCCGCLAHQQRHQRGGAWREHAGPTCRQ